jgi:putative ABC transport system substrate-binding protein
MAGGAPIGVQVDVVWRSDGRKIEVAFATLVRNRADASWSAPIRSSPPRQLATLATRHAIPAVYNGREFAETGGLMDYGTKVTEVYRQLGVKGAKPADLPVVQSSKFELVINAQAARNRRPPTSDSVGIAESELSRSLVVRASSD